MLHEQMSTPNNGQRQRCSRGRVRRTDTPEAAARSIARAETGSSSTRPSDPRSTPPLSAGHDRHACNVTRHSSTERSPAHFVAFSRYCSRIYAMTTLCPCAFPVSSRARLHGRDGRQRSERLFTYLTPLDNRAQ